MNRRSLGECPQDSVTLLSASPLGRTQRDHGQIECNGIVGQMSIVFPPAANDRAVPTIHRPYPPHRGVITYGSRIDQQRGRVGRRSLRNVRWTGRAGRVHCRCCVERSGEIDFQRRTPPPGNERRGGRCRCTPRNLRRAIERGCRPDRSSDVDFGVRRALRSSRSLVGRLLHRCSGAWLVRFRFWGS